MLVFVGRFFFAFCVCHATSSDAEAQFRREESQRMLTEEKLAAVCLVCFVSLFVCLIPCMSVAFLFCLCQDQVHEFQAQPQNTITNTNTNTNTETNTQTKTKKKTNTNTNTKRQTQTQTHPWKINADTTTKTKTRAQTTHIRKEHRHKQEIRPKTSTRCNVTIPYPSFISGATCQRTGSIQTGFLL
jgi:hypothetical protein